MAMVVQEFEMSEAFKNSDGKIIREYESNVFVAIYEEDDNKSFDLEDYLTNLHNGHKVNKEVVILPQKDWTAIQSMITRNYELKPKNNYSKED